MHAFLRFCFNTVLAISVVLLTVLTGNIIIGFFFVLLSKWRMLAVHPYYWLKNIRANLIDIIIGLSIVVLSWPNIHTNATFAFFYILLILIYAIWLNFIKPLTSTATTETQALFALFLSINASSLLFPSSQFFLTVATFALTIIAMRHILLQNGDENLRPVSLIFGLFTAEFTWFLYFWFIIYSFSSLNLVISQLSIFTTLIVFALNRVYQSYYRHDGRIKSHDILASSIFSVIIIIVMLIWFSKPIFNI